MKPFLCYLLQPLPSFFVLYLAILNKILQELGWLELGAVSNICQGETLKW